MAFHIDSPRFPGRGIRANAVDYRILFGNKNKLPQGSDIRVMNGEPIFLFARQPGDNRSKHRVHIACPCCLLVIPAGRAHQHKCKTAKALEQGTPWRGQGDNQAHSSEF